MNWIRAHLLTPFYNQDRRTQARIVLVVFLLAFAALCLGIYGMLRLAWQPTSLATADPVYAAAQRSMIVLANLQAAIPCFLLAVLLGIAGYKWWVRTHTGRSACAWARQEGRFLESEDVKAAKILNQGRLQAAWILGSLVFFGLVLR